jgi:hypothetical protein
MTKIINEPCASTLILNCKLERKKEKGKRHQRASYNITFTKNKMAISAVFLF